MMYTQKLMVAEYGHYLLFSFSFQDNTRPNFENNSVIEAVDYLLKTDFP